MTEYSTTIGIDLGDSDFAVCVLDKDGEILEEAVLRATPRAVTQRFGSMEPARIAIEAGTASRWVSHLLTELGHSVIVGAPRRLRMIFANENKNDRVDARTLARVARFDPKLLSPIEHRSHDTHVDLEVRKARDVLVEHRKRTVSHIRSIVKTFGHKLPKCDTDYFWRRTRALIPDELDEVLAPLYEVLEVFHEKILEYDRRIRALCDKYSETEILRGVTGVGPITSLAYVLVVEEPTRFEKSRDVGSYFGLRPRSSQSGESDPQLAITKCGSNMVRRLLVQSAHYITGHFGPDCDLRRFGERIAARGGKRAKKRATVAVARKLSVLLHRLWVTGEVYDPLWNAKRLEQGTG